MCSVRVFGMFPQKLNIKKKKIRIEQKHDGLEVRTNRSVVRYLCSVRYKVRTYIPDPVPMNVVSLSICPDNFLTADTLLFQSVRSQNVLLSLRAGDKRAFVVGCEASE